MKLLLAAVGQRQPSWAETAYDDFAKRFPPEMRLELKVVKAETRGSKTAEQLMAAEATRLEAALPKGERRVVLDERGTRLTTVQLAARMEAWQHDGRDVALLIGGPDGLDPALKATADETLRRRGSVFRAPVLAVAVGIYLPMELSAPIALGGLLAHLSGQGGGARGVAMLAAAGLITGEALMGIGLAVPIVLSGDPEVLSLGVQPLGAWPGILLMLALGLWIWRLRD